MLQHSIKPNILLVLTDQHRHDAVGYTNPVVQTPHLNALAAQSCVCTRAYTQSPQCQPSRASLLTGRYPTAHKVWWNGIRLPVSERTIANYLQAAGYNTGYFGKAHLVDKHVSDRQVIQQFGFQEHFLFADWVDYGSHEEYFRIMGSPYWTGRLSNRESQHEDVITQKTIAFMRRAKRPYFAVVSYVGPHPPYAAPPPFSTMYDPSLMAVPETVIPILDGFEMSAANWQELKAQYYGAVSWIDDNIGRLVAEASPETLVVFTSDHGDILGDHGLFSKGLYAYEGNTRVPMLIRSQYEPRRFDGLVQLIDILPTILGYAEAGFPAGIHGRNLLSALACGDAVNDYVLSMIGYEPRLRMLCDGRYKYWVAGDTEMLFDLAVDAAEKVNIGGPLLAEYRLKLLRALIMAEDPLPSPAE